MSNDAFNIKKKLNIQPDGTAADAKGDLAVTASGALTYHDGSTLENVVMGSVTDAIAANLADVSEDLNTAEAAIDQLEIDYAALEVRLSDVEDAVPALEAAVDARIDAVDLLISDIQSAGGALSSRIDANDVSIANLATEDFNLDARIDTLETSVPAHAALTAAHGATGAVVGTTNTQTLTNKTLTAPVINSPTGIVKGDVGLGNVDNTSDATKNAATATLTNKDIDGGTASNGNRITLPKAAKTTLDGLTRKEGTLVYATDQAKAYIDNGSSLTAVGSGSGGGGINFVAEGDRDAETDLGAVNVYADAAATTPVDGTGGTTGTNTTTNLTLSRTTTAGEVLAGTTSFKLVKTAASALGHGVSIPFTVPLGYRTKKTKACFKFKIVSGSLVEGDIVGYVIQDTTGTPTVHSTFEVGKLVGSQGEYVCYFDPSISYGDYRLALHFATTSTTAVTFVFDEISINDNQVAYGMAGSDWVYYTPTVAGLGSGTSTNYGAWRIVGDTAHVVVRITGATGGTGSSAVTATLPTVLTPDTTKTEAYTGYGNLDNANFGYKFSTFVTGSTIAMRKGATNGNVVGSDMVSSAEVKMHMSFPVVGRSSNVQMASSAQFKISDYLATGTRVTTTPTRLGEWRSMLRQASSVNFSDTNGAPSILPSTASGIAIYSGTGWGSTDNTNQPTRYEIFIGKNKQWTISYYASANRTGTTFLNNQAYYTGTTYFGYLTFYDSVSGVLTITPTSNGAQTNHIFGLDSGYNALESGYFDVTVSENALMVGNDNGAIVAARYSGPTGTVDTTDRTTNFATTTLSSPYISYASGVATVHIAGVYKVHTQLYLNGSFSAGNIIEVNHKKNGVTESTIDDRIQASSSFATIRHTTLINCNAGDTISSSHNSQGSSLGFAGGAAHSYMLIEKIAGTVYSAAPAEATVYAKYTDAAGLALTTSETVFNFGTVVEDTHGAVTTGAGVWKFTAPKSARYAYVAKAQSINRTNECSIYLNVKKGGTTYMSQQRASKGATTENQRLMPMVSGTIKLNQGEYFQIVTNRTAGGNVDIEADATSNMIEIWEIK